MYYSKLIIQCVFLFELYLELIFLLDFDMKSYLLIDMDTHKKMFDYIFGYFFYPITINKKYRDNLKDKFLEIKMLFNDYCLFEDQNVKKKIIHLTNNYLCLIQSNHEIIDYGNSLIKEDNITIQNIINNYLVIYKTVINGQRPTLVQAPNDYLPDRQTFNGYIMLKQNT